MTAVLEQIEVLLAGDPRTFSRISAWLERLGFAVVFEKGPRTKLFIVEDRVAASIFGTGEAPVIVWASDRKSRSVRGLERIAAACAILDRESSVLDLANALRKALFDSFPAYRRYLRAFSRLEVELQPERGPKTLGRLVDLSPKGALCFTESEFSADTGGVEIFANMDGMRERFLCRVVGPRPGSQPSVCLEFAHEDYRVAPSLRA